MTELTDRRALLLAALLVPSGAGSGCATTSGRPDAEAYITERSREWTASYTTGKTEVMEGILAEDFVGTSPSGTRSSKKDALESARRGPDTFVSAVMQSVQVKVFDGVALAFGNDLLTVRGATPTQEHTAWTDTWLLRGGAWVVVASHESIVKSAA
jgi:hypothetical protein